MKQIILFLMIPFIGFSQHTRKVFVETGISTFKPFVKEERVFGNLDYQYSADLKNTYKTTSGFFVKCGIEILPKTEKKFSITVPLSIGYKEFNKKRETEGWAYGCFSSFNGIEKSQISSKSASVMFGPKFNFNTEKFIIYAAININADLFFQNTETSEYKPINSETYSYSKSSQPYINDFVISTSLQLGLDYKISSRWTLGLSTNCYFFNFNPIIYGDKLNTNLFNIGYGKQSLFICSGIRAGYAF